ncbi:positive regulator of sigma E activity [Virgibacillus natechei]|uniref:Positive regulator of sigma E activity n=1 Tax=Virgibacillus natechei TaxID=1216297 RepID=A0ABS4II29_9BACI|nr:DUF2651 family protein [Virgibacillus natechei]MBP1970538.1 positive regulator of sigma E activity [Virgibacillus natechei]UZD14059.1 YbeF family protein [Virgibacillus natechei]
MNIIPLIIFIFPIGSIILGAIGYFIFKNIYMTPLIVAFISIILTFTTFNSSFWFWVFIYTFLAFVSGFIAKVLFSKRMYEGD